MFSSCRHRDNIPHVDGELSSTVLSTDGLASGVWNQPAVVPHRRQSCALMDRQQATTSTVVYHRQHPHPWSAYQCELQQQTAAVNGVFRSPHHQLSDQRYGRIAVSHSPLQLQNEYYRHNNDDSFLYHARSAAPVIRNYYSRIIEMYIYLYHSIQNRSFHSETHFSSQSIGRYREAQLFNEEQSNRT